MSARKIAYVWSPLGVYLMVLSLGSELRRLPGIEDGGDKVLHVLAYALLALMTLRAFQGGISPPRRWMAAGAVLFAVLYGVSEEVRQAFVPERTASALDALADIAGALLAVPLMGLLALRRGEKRNRRAV